MNKALIIGAGFLGSTLYQAFEWVPGWDVRIHDINPFNSKLQQDINSGELNIAVKWAPIEFAKEANLIFICLPTPMAPNGSCFTGAIEGTIQSIRSLGSKAQICIKSTVPPGTTQRLNERYGNICFSPEFLTEANALNDFINLKYQIIGYPEVMPDVFDSLECQVSKLYAAAAKRDPLLKHHPMELAGGDNIISISSTAAEMVKYMRNCYLATRLSFFNEMKQVCDKLGLRYPDVACIAGLDSRVGAHYNHIDEAEPEFSGSCLPKDLNAFIHFAKELGVDPKVASAVWAKNLEVAKKKTWLKEKGRAVV